MTATTIGISDSTSSSSSLLTNKDMGTIARNVFNDPSVKVLRFSLKPYSKDKLGFTASHQLLEITYQSNKSKKEQTLQLFVKSIEYDNTEQLDFIKEGGIFDEEVVFFDKIFPWLNDIYRGEKWSPIVYLVKNDAMIMEDLRTQGYKLRGRFFDQVPLLKAALEALARFHSCSILAEAELERLSGRPKTLAEHYPNNFSEKIFCGNSGAGQWVAGGVKVTAAIAEVLGLDSRKLRKSYDSLRELVKTSSKHRNVICHGDLWTNNIMFDDTLPQPKCVLVDYQVIRYAPLALDLLHLLYINTTREYREKNERSLIAHYHLTLERHVRMNDASKSGCRTPSLEDTLTAYEELRVFGSCNANLYMPFVLLDPKIIGERLEKEGFKDCVFGDRVQQTLDYMKQDEFYKARIEENARELVELSDRLF